jgi:hypothetical protein
MKKALEALRDVVQEDAGGRGLGSDPAENLLTACAGDFAAACRSIAEREGAVLGVVTGFYIPTADPPCGETDGPLGAVFLARALLPLGIQVVLATDPFCRPALQAGLEAVGLGRAISVHTLPDPFRTDETPTHYIALERAGPSHTLASLQAQPGVTAEVAQRFAQEVPTERQGRCYTMRGRDITEFMGPAHLLFEEQARFAQRVPTIGIGDGGNEIGMGKIAWDVIRRNIPGGGLIACRVPTDHLIVCGVSNWGAYALAAGVRLLRGAEADAALFDPTVEENILRRMVEEGPLVDGKTGRQEATVDGLPFARHAEVLRRLGQIVAG